jgi:subtilisin
MKNVLRLVVGGVCLVAALVGAVSAANGTAGTAAATGPGRYVVVLKDGSNASSVAAKHARKYGAEVSFVYKHALKGYAAKLSASAHASVQADPDVLFVSDDRELAVAAPAETFPQVTQRSITRIGGDQSSTRSGDGRGSVPINVAVIDTGIDTDHPDLNVVGGTNCVGDKNGFEDIFGHGTLVAGSIGSLDNAIGFVGVVPGARLWAVRVLQQNGSGTTSQIICGIDWVTSTRTDSDPTNDIPVANMSIRGQLKDAEDGNCGRTRNDPIHLAICHSVAAGVTYVAAAGNESNDIRDNIPAAYREVLTATAMSDTDGVPGGLGGLDICGDGQSDDVPATFSSFATSPADQAHTIAAPGVCVPSSYLGGGNGHGSGTSFASPLVAGTVALCIYSGPCAGLTPAQLVKMIVADAAAYNNSRKGTGYGFQGDPLRPISGKYYGYLIRAGLY